MVVASSFLQQLLWTAVWLQSLKAASSRTPGKKGKKSANVSSQGKEVTDVPLSQKGRSEVRRQLRSSLRG
jgi:hypothetical protein